MKSSPAPDPASTTPVRPPATPVLNNSAHAMATPSPEVQAIQARHAEETAMMRAEFQSIKKQLADLALNKDTSPGHTPPKRHAPKLKDKKAPKSDLEQVDLTDVSKKLKDSCHLLMRSLMMRRTGTSPLPLPPDSFYVSSLQKFLPGEKYPDNDAAPAISSHDVQLISELDGKIDRDYIDYVHATMRRWKIRFFTFQWDAHFDDRFNQIMCQFFLKVWKWGLTLGRLGIAASQEAERLKMDELVLLAILWKHVMYLKGNYKKLAKNSEALEISQAKNSQTVALLRKSEIRERTLVALCLAPEFIQPFENRHCNSDDEFDHDPQAHNVRVRYSKIPYWRSEKATRFIDWIEEKARFNATIRVTGLKNRAKAGPQVIPRARRTPPVINRHAVVPAKLPEDWYDTAFLNSLLPGKKAELELKPAVFGDNSDFNKLIPKGKEDAVMEEVEGEFGSLFSGSDDEQDVSMRMQ